MTKKKEKLTKEFEPNLIENRVCSALGRLLITPYNWSLILLAVLIWSFGDSLVSYSANANFDMAVAVNEYSKNISMFAIAVGLYFSERRAHLLVGLGVANYLLCFGSIIMSKTLFLHGLAGEFLFKSLSIFCLLLILKNIWILALDKEMNRQAG